MLVRVVAAAVLVLASCKKDEPHQPLESKAATLVVAPTPAPDAPKLGALAMQIPVHERPVRASKVLGFLRLGAKVAREAKPSGTEGCRGGSWYKIFPRGYVCTGENEATNDLSHPLLRAAEVRPDLQKPLPYAYGFVRAVSPLYLRVPSSEEQFQTEFGLEKHLAWWRSPEGSLAQKAAPGANDVGKPATERTEGELFGGRSNEDPPPFWLEGGKRTIPNVSGYKVPPQAVFANRVRRHTGLAFVGSFPTTSEGRRFAITTDLRLVPTSKVKPDAGSPFHGIELGGESSLPFAWVRGREASVYTLSGERLVKTEEILARRAVTKVTGKVVVQGGSRFRELEPGKWARLEDLGAVLLPTEFPPAANQGEKWIEVSIENQTLVLWEGKKPVYATLVSTGQDGLGDPKTTKSTVRGTFRIRTKHVTATMDSNGEESEGEEAVSEKGEGPKGRAKKEPKAKQEVPKEEAKGASKDEAGKAVRRGQGTFELRDVPWIQYFEHGYALHAAYWHDVFGVARSHGCINLSPIDAHRVFFWTEPQVPPEWHSVNAHAETGTGTVVIVHR